MRSFVVNQASVAVDDINFVNAVDSDGVTGQFGVPNQSFNVKYNGASWDMDRANVNATALASAARTTTTSSSTITAHNARGIIIHWNITAVSTSSVQIGLYNVDPISGNQALVVALPTAVTTTGYRTYEFYPGVSATPPASGNSNYQRTSATISRSLVITVTHGNANSTTYSVGYTLLV